MTFTAVFSAKNKTDLDKFSKGLDKALDDALEEGADRRYIGATPNTYKLLVSTGLPITSDFEALIASPLKEVAEKLGKGAETQEERTQLLALLVLINGNLPGFPKFDMIVGNPTSLEEKVKGKTDAQLFRYADASGLSLLHNGLRSGCIVVPHHSLYDDVLEWIRNKRPHSNEMYNRLQAHTDMVLGFHHMDNLRFMAEHGVKI